METKRQLTSETRDAVLDLIRINADSHRGFEQAAEAIDSAVFAALFQRIAGMRKQHADELCGYVETDGERAGSFKGQLHRWWLELRGTLQDGAPHAILAEAERGEDEIKQRYETLMKANAGSALSDVLHRHYAEIKQHHDQIRDLRDAEKK